MKKISVIVVLLFLFVAIGETKAFYGVPHGSYSYSTAYYPDYNYGYGGYYHYGPGYHRSYQRRHPIKDERELRYIREYYKAVNGYEKTSKKYKKGTTYQNGDKVVNININM